MSFRSLLRHIAVGLLIAAALASARVAYAIDEIHPDLIRRVELQWEPETDAVEYELELGTNPDFSSTLYAEKLKDTKYTVDLLPGAYYYRVRAIDKRERPGRWTPTQELNINARPPILYWPQDGEVIHGNLPDTGLPLEWRTSGPGIRYLIEIKGADETGAFSKTIVRQEVDATHFEFFPQDPGKYQWSVHTLGAGGDEPGAAWVFEVEGVFFPRGADHRVVRYVAPWWRNHWYLYSRYGQSQLSYSIVDQDLRATGSFSGLGGYINETLNWEWHDPASWLMDGTPWFELEYQLDRLTVLSESVVLHREIARIGAWYEGAFTPKLRLTPLISGGLREIPIYQPVSEVEAGRSTSVRKVLGVGAGAEFKLKPFLVLAANAQVVFERGGLGGQVPAAGKGDQFDVARRVQEMNSSTSYEAELSGTLLLGSRMKVQGRARYEHADESWTPAFPTQSIPGVPSGDSQFSLTNFTFDVSFGIKF